jgi:hydroxymethylglutaryl-CoA reductase
MRFSFLNLIAIDVQPDGRLLFLRFHATTGDAMGMNMVTK